MLAERGAPVLIGIAGSPGVGKTTLALELVAALGDRAAHVPMDGFHLPDAELTRLSRANRKGAPDTFDADGYAALLQRIRAAEDVWAPDFDRSIEEPIAQRIFVAARTPVVVSEGNYLLLRSPEWVRVRRCFDEVWFLHGDDAARVARLIARHVQFGKSPAEAREWVLRSDESNAALVAASASLADVVVEV